jgi:hypothetical protein
MSQQQFEELPNISNSSSKSTYFRFSMSAYHASGPKRTYESRTSLRSDQSRSKVYVPLLLARIPQSQREQAQLLIPCPARPKFVSTCLLVIRACSDPLTVLTFGASVSELTCNQIESVHPPSCTASRFSPNTTTWSALSPVWPVISVFFLKLLQPVYVYLPRTPRCPERHAPSILSRLSGRTSRTSESRPRLYWS